MASQQHHQPATSPWTDAYQAAKPAFAAMADAATRSHRSGTQATAHDEQQPTHDALADIYNRSTDDQMRKRV